MEARIKYLFRQYLENQCTRREFDEFFALLRDASDNQQLRELISNAYREMGQESLTYVDETGNLVLPEPEWFSGPVSISHKSKSNRTKLLWAATTIAAALTAVYLMRHHSPVTTKEAENLKITTTERSEFRYLLLPDSTQVWLNVASKLEYPAGFGSNTREVILSGEAYFDVKHAAEKPFIIHTGKIRTTVLGTAFNIKAYDNLDNVIVAVSRGKVRVNYLDKELVTLTHGQQAKINNKGAGIAEWKSGVNQVATWQEGNLVYEDESIMDIIADLERVYNVRIRVNDITVSNMRISTSFNRQTGVEQALQIICSLTERRMVQQNGQYFIY